MQIKPQALAQHLRTQLAPIYVVLGQDLYFLEQAVSQIQAAARAAGPLDESRLCIESLKDWQTLFTEANSYSLFYDKRLVLASFEKKTLEAEAKNLLTQYLKAINPACTLLLKAPSLPAKQLSFLSTSKEVVVVTAYPLAPAAMKQWIGAQLKQYGIRCEASVPELIYQYTQGNSLACAQALEKISLIQEANTVLTLAAAARHLSFQCEHTLFELSEACLLGKAALAIQIIRQSAQSKVEASLVLWMLTNEIRILMLLQNQQAAPIPDFKKPLYLQCLQRFSKEHLGKLLQSCQGIDLTIKTHAPLPAWQALERLALQLCTA